jgi:Spy/CpxP family protein refolding chaperone
MSIKKALAGSLLAASLLVSAVSLTGIADPLPVKAEKACAHSKSCGDAKKCDHHQKGSMKSAMMADFEEKIGLSEDQKKKFAEIRKEGEAKAKPLADQMFAKRRALYEYLADPNATETEALAKQGEIDALRSQLSQQRLSGMFRLKAVLTPEQQKKAAELMQAKLAECDKKKAEKGW